MGVLPDLGMLNSQIWKYTFANLGMLSNVMLPRFQNYSQFRPWYLTDTGRLVSMKLQGKDFHSAKHQFYPHVITQFTPNFQ